MPVKFVSLDKDFCDRIRSYSYEAYNTPVEQYVPVRKTYYVSPANSLCFMDGGIDAALSRVVFPNIEPRVKKIVNMIGRKSLMGRCYLPIGSSIVVDYDAKRSLIVAPTMLLPQDVSTTHNAFYSTMAVFYNLAYICGEDLNQVDVIMTAMCGGIGRMPIDESINQMLAGMEKYREYKPEQIDAKNKILICEPNLEQQKKLYQNTEWINVPVTEVVHC